MSLPAFTAHLVPSSQSFVSLPAAVVDDILKHDENAVSLVLRLSWKVDADSHETYVSWCGGIAVEPGSIEIPQEFGICLGISEGIKVKANIPKKKPRRAKTVHVSPLTADDWEVLELHPEELEGQILNQINIVTQKMIIPIWTSNGACIRVRVDELDPVPSAKTPAAKLDNKTEVIVAPRTRERQPEPQASAGEGEVPEPVYEPRLLRVVPHPCELSEQGMQTLEECHGRQHTDSRLQFTALVSGQTAVDCGWPSGILCSLTRCGGAKSEPGCGSRAHSVHQAKEAESAAKSDHDAAGSDHSNNGGLVRQAAHSQVAPLDRATCTGAFLYLQAVNSVHIPYNHIILPVEIRRQLGVPLLTRVKLRPSSRVARLAPPALPTQPLRLHPVRWISGDTSQVGSEAQFEKFDFKTAEEGAPASESTRNSQFPDSAAILSAFADFRASFADTPSEDSTAQMIPALQGSLIKLLVPASNSGNPSSPQALHVLLKFDAALSLLCEPVPIDEDAAEATDVDMALPSAVATITAKDLRWIDTDRCPDPLKVTVGSSIQLRGLGAPGGRGEPGFFAGPTLTDMVGVEDAKASVLRHVSAQLAAAPMRHALGLPPGGGVLIYGQSGTGKSALAAAVANAFRHVNSPQNCVEGPAGSPQAESTAPVYTLHIDCASFVGAKAGPLKRAWRNMLAQAHQNAPSILICDDLDSLVPEGGQDGQQAAARETVALGRFFADLLFPSKASTLRPPGSAVAVIACVKDKGAVTQRLRVPGRLDFEVGLTLPDAAGRKGQIQALLDQLGVATGPPHVDLAALAARTDSFAAADLKRLAKRIAHHAAARYIKHVSPPAEAYTTITEEPQAEAPGCRVEGSKVVVTEADIELAIDGIAPAALQGVKLSSVGSDAKGWADVGGMAKVRSTLREMFELPAKYPELFGTRYVSSSSLRARVHVQYVFFLRLIVLPYAQSNQAAFWSAAVRSIRMW
eukprot:SAG31_NODE_148_length_22511_cov_20.369266_11_plen_970_part_00